VDYELLEESWVLFIVQLKELVTNLNVVAAQLVPETHSRKEDLQEIQP